MKTQTLVYAGPSNQEKFGARIEAGMRIGFKFQVIENVTGQAGKAIFVMGKGED